MSVRPAKTQISLGIHPVWSESSLGVQWVAKDPSFLHADTEDSDQTGRMPRLICLRWAHSQFVGFIMRRSSNNNKNAIKGVISKYSGFLFVFSGTETVFLTAKRSCFVFLFSIFIFSEVSLFFVIRFSMFIFRSKFVFRYSLSDIHFQMLVCFSLFVFRYSFSEVSLFFSLFVFRYSLSDVSSFFVIRFSIFFFRS